jgi:predicted restriction endonuclease
VDPAHLVPRGVGGCDDALCVVPLCRIHHRAYDRGTLDLVPYLEPRFRAEAAHAVTHLGLVGALRRLSGNHGVGTGA